MAYLRNEKQTVEIDYSLAEVWSAIPEVIASLEWKMEQVDDAAHHAMVKTKGGFMSYGSTLMIDGVPVDKTKCRVTVHGETPVTTITALADFGRASDRIQLFFETLAKRLNTTKKS